MAAGRQYDPTQRAIFALNGGKRQERKHMKAGDPEKARRALSASITTAISWLDGTHPKHPANAKGA